MLNAKLQQFNSLKSEASRLIIEKLGKDYSLQHLIPSRHSVRTWTVAANNYRGIEHTTNKTFQTIINAGLHKQYNVVDCADVTFENCMTALQDLIDRLNNFTADELEHHLNCIGRSVYRISLALIHKGETDYLKT